MANSFPEWQDEAVAILRDAWDAEKKSFTGKEKEVLAKKGLMKNKAVMPFVMTMKVCFIDFSVPLFTFSYDS